MLNKFRLVFQHKESKEIITKILTLDELIENSFEDIMELECDCEPVGETNVVECNCEDYLYGFELIAKEAFTGLKDKNGQPIYEGDIVFIDNAILNKLNLNWLGPLNVTVKIGINTHQMSWEHFSTAGTVINSIHDKE